MFKHSISLDRDLIQRLRAAQRVVVLTGAGISAESGVPTFREAQTGLWAQYTPEELATPHAFQKNPQRVWEWYEWRRDLILQAKPNPGHHALARLEARLKSHSRDFTLITQNVDGLHQRAGSKNVLELHGNLHRTRCSQCNDRVDHWDTPDTPPPKCPNCGGNLRPDVVWFGESLPPEVLRKAIAAVQRCDVLLVVGTSAVVHPAASLPRIAREGRGIRVTLVEINPQPTAISSQMDYILRYPAGEILPKLVIATVSNPRR